MPGLYSFNLGLNQKRFGGNNQIANVSINLGSTKGRGSSTRMFNYCKQRSANPSECINQFINVSVPAPPTPTCDYTFSGTGVLTQAIVNANIGTAQAICIQGYTSIGNSAFENKTQITSVNILNSVTSIGDNAFESCTGLTSVTIPSSVTSIGINAFTVCTGLTSIIIPSSVTSIGNYAFSSCTSLTNIVTNAFISDFGEVFFGLNNVGLSITFNYVGVIPDGACNGRTNLANVILGNVITSIGSSAFTNCSSLTSIIIPSSVTSIDSLAFQDSGLTTVTIANGQLGITSPSPSQSFFGKTVVTILP